MKPMQKTPFSAFNPAPRGKGAILSFVVGGLLLFPLATQAGFWDSALMFGKNLLATAAGNYTSKYEQDLTQLLHALRQPGTTNQPFIQGITPGNMPGYPYDPYAQQPTQQGYPNSQQGYPNDPYAQQAYPQDPYAQQPTQQDHSNSQQGYPNDPYAQQAYPQDPTAQTGHAGQGGAVGTPVGLDVAIVKKTEVNGTETMIPIKDGDLLKDGRGNAQAGDKFRIMFRANTDCYVYVIAIDGSAWAQGVFPSLSSPFANPVKQGQQYIIPENNNWLSLDQFKGIETIFFVASPEKRQDIEDILASIAGKERHPRETPQQVTEAPIIPAGFHRSQPSRTPFIIGQQSHSPQGQDQGLIPTTYFTQKAGEALRVTRWFRHE
jgi:hypothetical protein